MLRGAIAGGIGLVVGYGVGLVDTFFGGITFYYVFNRLAPAIPFGLLTVAILVGGIGGIETALHAANGGSWNDVAVHLGIVAGVSAVGLLVGSGIFLASPRLETLAAVPVGAGVGAGLAQMVLVFVDLSASQIPE